MKRVLSGAQYVGARLALTGGAVLAMAQSALAQSFDASDVNEIPIYDGDLMDLVTRIVNIILIVVGIIAVVYLIYGGIQYVTAGGEAEKATKGRTTITNAIIGIVIIAASLAIYNYVVGNI